MLHVVRIRFALALLAATACDNGDAEPIPCERDSDCPVGQVCGTDGFCTGAAAGDTKEFGQVELDFSTGNETYLLAIYALPTGAEAASFDYVSFSIDQGGAPAGALRWQATPTKPAYDVDYWADRNAFEAQRRTGIESVVRDLRAERLSFGNRAVPKQANACSDDEFFFPNGVGCQTEGNVTFTDGSSLLVDVAGTYGTATKIKVLVDRDSASNTQAATDAATAFASSVDAVLAAFGESSHGTGLDRNQDGSLAVVFSDKIATVGNGNIVGFFEHRDFMDSGTTTSDGITATGNEADLLWSRVPSQTRAGCPASGCASSVITHEVSVGTLAHEYTHLVTYARRVHGAGTGAQNEVLWLDEGTAHLMEDASGWGASNIGVVAAAFAGWPNTLLAGPPGDTSSDTPAQRGQAYLYLRYLAEQGSSASDAAGVNISLPGDLLDDTELGFLHPAIVSHGADGFWGWLLATFATNHPEVTDPGAIPAKYLAVGNHATTGQPVGVDPNGTYRDARNSEIILSSDDILGDGSNDELTETDFPFESEIGVSGSMLLKVTSSETGTTTLTGTGAAEVNLQMRAIRVW